MDRVFLYANNRPPEHFNFFILDMVHIVVQLYTSQSIKWKFWKAYSNSLKPMSIAQSALKSVSLFFAHLKEFIEDVKELSIVINFQYSICHSDSNQLIIFFHQKSDNHQIIWSYCIIRNYSPRILICQSSKVSRRSTIYQILRTSNDSSKHFEAHTSFFSEMKRANSF